MAQNTLDPIIIIGCGLAGYSLAKELRKIDKTVALVLITQDEGHFYSKPQLSAALSQGKTPQSLIITPFTEMQTQLNATIYTQSEVLALDPAAQQLTVRTPQGDLTLGFRDLIFANGAKPKPFPLLDGVKHHRINSLQDYAQFIEDAKTASRLTIIGSGLVGCEFAHDFTKIFQSIHVITPDRYPLFGLVPAVIGAKLQKTLERQGIQWRTEQHLTQIEQSSDSLRLHLSSGERYDSEMILCAIGLSPNIYLAQKAGIATKQGILVDNYLQTQHPHIFALGDCAEISGVCRQYVAPILQSARALAQTLCGTPTAVSFPHFPISLKVPPYPIITFPAPSSLKGEWQIEENEDSIKALFFDTQGILQGYALSGTFLEARQTCLQALGKAMNVYTALS